MVQNKLAVVLLSGGLDSTTVLAMACEAGFECHAITFDYGQKQLVELEAAAAVAERFGCKQHRVVRIDLGAFGGSALTSNAIDVPKNRAIEEVEAGIPVTYVPARNTVFLSYALALAEVVGAFDIFIGANHVDYSGYPDCRPAFIDAFTKLANLATRASVEDKGRFTVHAPLMEMDKAAIVKAGIALGVDYSLTHSCYDPVDGKACGQCDACALRRRGFEQAGLADPTRYHAGAA
jgi:7-cyano-7-deazaguanine synthase